MIDVEDLHESALGDYWLQVWRRFVEVYSDYTTIETNGEWYSFAHLRKCQPKMVVDDRVADLATNYWERNRGELKEYFINWTCDKWSCEVAIEKDVTYGGWIDCGADLAYPHRRYEDNTNDTLYLAKTRQLQLMLKKAKLDVFLEKMLE